ncbi:hypothetical protein FIBSPDRAFT_857159 [Athelia psychrophila]|uniref:Uncharacterized protein n=1 Tax=Athelia psychrophila TaxID=1759441 RepID=A0A166MYT1_9AGAM|nr:hypothetical protein FIBSPDRAFT_857159 [Fibularhizoctonia sp. CBS 109695]
MNFTSIFLIFAALFTVGAAPVPIRQTVARETNASRMGRGLPPLAPLKLTRSPTAGAKRGEPSGRGGMTNRRSTRRT